jgi:glycine/D-amino acid oxidase-like deaminating enzyme
MVVGGGVAGIAAAVAAARSGAKTLLVERFGFLGGIATAGGMNMGFAPYDTTSGIGREIYTRLISRDAAVDDVVVPFDPEEFKYEALQMATDAGVEFLFHSQVVESLTQEGRMRGVVVENKSGRSAVLADVVIDTTGDGDVSARAGASYIIGRERDGKMRPISVLFRIGGIDVPALVRYVKENPGEFARDPAKNIVNEEKDFYRLVGFFGISENARSLGELDPAINYVRVENLRGKTSMGMINTSRVYNLDGTDATAITKAEIEARQQNAQVYAMLKKYCPGFAKSFVMDSATMLGVRETRHLIGDYVLTEQDIADKRRFDSNIARNAVRITPFTESHSPDGTEGSRTDTRHREVCEELTWHGVPYESLLPKDIDNLLAAGRCLSVDHEADKWTRIQICCMATGQAAGTAAAIAVRQKVPPRRVPVKQLQEALVGQGVILDY